MVKNKDGLKGNALIKLLISHSKKIASAVIAGVIIAVISSIILDYLFLEKAPDDRIVYAEPSLSNSATPQLWSHHKILAMNAQECAIKGQKILTSLAFSSIVKNNEYVYGNFEGNRAVIKCVSLAEKTFVYTAVAGKDVKRVEKLRNEISWKL